MTNCARLLIACLLLSVLAPRVTAHEIRPGFLELVENAPAQYAATLKVPVRSGRPLAVNLVFHDGCAQGNVGNVLSETGMLVTTFTLNCYGSLESQTIAFPGLEVTITDIIVRLVPIDGKTQTLRATPEAPFVTLTERESGWLVAPTYFMLGVDHILLGADHLLFVFALVLLIPGTRRLVETVTSFTLSHSLTLVGVSLGWFTLPTAAVEAVIALSIVFLACEIANKRSGQLQLSERCPWLVASVFGLLHGFGFAGALAQIGLPEGDVVLALAAFNTGVEVGQLAFLAVVLMLLLLIQRLGSRKHFERFASYTIGIAASFWLFERLF